ncbi:DEAD/DEAH box helicase [Boudabousia liubingyangii]|uniref:DEAD/DEAH box helicase n=1 Tax=Boudabousia liubingyangii TaxID=1921764 RepID=UPI0009FA56D6|nr:DEAD/DEAH box helicase [Boudabousia liubingyangii]
MTAADAGQPTTDVPERLGQFLTNHYYAEQLREVLEVPARPASYQPWPEWVPDSIRDLYATQGVDQPWAHQAQAAQALHDGQPVVLSTGTGSGKSLAAWLPILSDLATLGGPELNRISLVSRRPTALYLSPTKALAADQLNSLQQLLAHNPALGVRVTTADGDTQRELKQWSRAHADLVISNPDYIHHAMLSNHGLWTRFLSSLRYLIIDELHSYRGVAGAHMALVVRRLLRVARHYGAQVSVIALSATSADPAGVLARFLGIDQQQVVSVSEDGSPAGVRRLFLWQPALLGAAGVATNETPAPAVSQVAGADPWEVPAPALSEEVSGTDPGVTSEPDAEQPLAPELAFQRRAVTTEAAHLSAEFVRLGARSLTFVRSRYAAEQVAQVTRRLLDFTDPELAPLVAAYRGGFLPEERRELEDLIRRGKLRSLSTTNALELGIDLSALDATITAGWPGTRASLWQQSGRSGRAGRDGVSVFVAAEDPLDQYFLDHPQELLDPPEPTAFEVSNPFVLGPHLCAAAAELPLTEADFGVFGFAGSGPADSPQAGAEFLAKMVAAGWLSKRPAGWFWNATLGVRAHDLADLRGMGTQVQVVLEDSGQVIGQVDQASAQNLVHPGAIYVHQAKLFEVQSLTDEVAIVRPYRGDLRTRPSEHVSVEVLQVEDEFSTHDGLVRWHFGTVNVITETTDYDILRVPGMVFVANRRLSLPPRILETKSVWWTVDPSVPKSLGIDPAVLPGSLHGAEHALIGILPLLASCDRWDLGGLSTDLHPQTGLPTVFVHDAVAGGAGFARAAFEQARAWVIRTGSAVADCSCDGGKDDLGSNGCPRCVQSPKCGNRNEPLDRAGAARLLRYLALGLDPQTSQDVE